MTARQQYHEPQVLGVDGELDLEKVRDNLLEDDVDSDLEEKPEKLVYSGSRFEFVFWSRSVIFRDYVENKVEKDDLYAWEEFADAVKEDLKYPPE